MSKNINISDILNAIIKLLELHQSNIFKINSYKNAVRYIKKTELDLSKLSVDELMNIGGIGKSIAYNIKEICETGKSKALENLLNKTPKGVIEMLKINGLGPKKIKMLWDKTNIDSLDKLLDACNSQQIAKLKGFGQKTQELIIKEIEFLKLHRNKCLYSIAIFYADSLMKHIIKKFPNVLISITGELRRKIEIINKIEIIIGSQDKTILEWFDKNELLIKDIDKSTKQIWKGKFHGKDIEIEIQFCDKKDYYKLLILTTGSKKHLELKYNNKDTIKTAIENYSPKSEKEFYKSIKMDFIPPELREGSNEIELALKNNIPKLIEISDIKGMIHAHSKYSDGLNSLLEMTNHCIKRGFQYLGITDHSKTAVYAGGMTIEELEHQHKEIDKINKIFSPFKIFKGLESDILKDGSLDYEDKILQKFDFIIGSIHSGFKMTEKQATDRIINAIKNPYITILGHPTGRLLLKRNGYPINHKAIIDECAKNNVIIEINANPNRLDLDWRWINYAISKKVLLSINSDAHSIIGFDNIQYGVAMARKGGASKNEIFTSFNLKKVEELFINRKIKNE